MSHSQFHCTVRVYLDLHGLIFETSICYWQDQPGSPPSAGQRAAGTAPARPPPTPTGGGERASGRATDRPTERCRMCGKGRPGPPRLPLTRSPKPRAGRRRGCRVEGGGGGGGIHPKLGRRKAWTAAPSLGLACGVRV